MLRERVAHILSDQLNRSKAILPSLYADTWTVPSMGTPSQKATTRRLFISHRVVKSALAISLDTDNHLSFEFSFTTQA